MICLDGVELILLTLTWFILFRFPTLTGWGITAGLTAIFVVERVPYFRKNIFSKVPYLFGERYSAYRQADEDEGK